MAGTAEPPVWRAIDLTLDRPADVLLLGDAGHRRAEVLDAARRAALVEDPRLIRVLDVADGDPPFAVTEHLSGRDLVQLCETGPLPAETVRRLIGEAAQALAKADSRGLHHLCLAPRQLLVLPDGSVKVRGTAIEAALRGLEPLSSRAARRADAVALVRLLYAGLTGRWPTADADAGPTGLDAAPLVAGQPVPPGDLVAGVPSDLDTLCSVTLGPHSDGPLSPRELADQIAPWAGPRPIESAGGLDSTGPTRPIRPVRPAPPTPAQAPGRAPEDPFAALAPGDLPVSAQPAAAADEPTVLTPAAGEPAPMAATSAMPAAGYPPDAPPGTAVIEDPLAWVQSAPSEPDRPSPFLEPFGLTLPPADVPEKEQSRTVLILVIAALALGLVIAVNSLPGVGGLFAWFSAEEDPVIPITTDEGAAPTRTSSPSSTTEQATAGDPAAIAAVQAIDPEGDNEENGDKAPLAIDGDPGTAWETSRYNTAAFGGLKKGLGLVIDLGQERPVTAVVVDVAGDGGRLELRPAGSATDAGSDPVAEAQITGGPVTLAPSQPMTARYLVVWCTELPRTDGEHRLRIPEIEVR